MDYAEDKKIPDEGNDADEKSVRAAVWEDVISPLIEPAAEIERVSALGSFGIALIIVPRKHLAFRVDPA